MDKKTAIQMYEGMVDIAIQKGGMLNIVNTRKMILAIDELKKDSKELVQKLLETEELDDEITKKIEQLKKDPKEMNKALMVLAKLKNEEI